MQEFVGIDQAEALILLEGGRPKRLTLAGCIAYHAEGRHVGVVLGFLLVKRLLEALPLPPERRAVSIRSGHPGSGMEDAFEHLLRAVSEKRYERATFPDGPIVAGAPGSFQFKVMVGENGFRILLHPEVLDPALFTKPNPSDPDDAAIRWTRQQAAITALLAAPPAALFDLSPLSAA